MEVTFPLLGTRAESRFRRIELNPETAAESFEVPLSRRGARSTGRPG